MTESTSDRAPVAVLLNPTAGRGRYRPVLPAILDRLRASGRELEVLDADTPRSALEACRAAVRDGAGALVAAGGDGTVHSGLQAVAGTGNDFVVQVGLPEEPIAAAEAVAGALREGTSRKVDLARLTDADGEVRWFGAVLAAGFDAIVNERANRMRFPKGPRRYDEAIVSELLRLRPRPFTRILDGV